MMGTMRKQILSEYNNTANATPESGNRITVAWNALQVQVFTSVALISHVQLLLLTADIFLLTTIINNTNYMHAYV